MKSPSHIGTLAERSLHAALKQYLSQEGDALEVPLDGFVIDLVRGEQLIEVQTRNFSALRRKLPALLEHHPLCLVHPIPAARWILRLSEHGEWLSRRKSPHKGRVEHLFWELVRLPGLMQHPHFSLHILLIHEEQVFVDDGQGSWRRKKWSLQDRRLLEVVGEQHFSSPQDFLPLLPPDLPQPFTSRDLLQGLGIPARLAGKMLYSLREMGAVQQVGQRGRAYLYTWPDAPPAPPSPAED